jgi:hypothetical protein
MDDNPSAEQFLDGMREYLSWMSRPGARAVLDYLGQVVHPPGAFSGSDSSGVPGDDLDDHADDDDDDGFVAGVSELLEPEEEMEPDWSDAQPPHSAASPGAWPVPHARGSSREVVTGRYRSRSRSRSPARARAHEPHALQLGQPARAREFLHTVSVRTAALTNSIDELVTVLQHISSHHMWNMLGEHEVVGSWMHHIRSESFALTNFTSHGSALLLLRVEPAAASSDVE